MNLKEEFEGKFFTEMEYPNNEKIPVLFTQERRTLLWSWIEQAIKEACKEQRELCFQNLIKAKLPEGYMSIPEWNYRKMNQMQIRDYILNAPEPNLEKK